MVCLGESRLGIRLMLGRSLACLLLRCVPAHTGPTVETASQFVCAARAERRGPYDESFLFPSSPPLHSHPVVVVVVVVVVVAAVVVAAVVQLRQQHRRQQQAYQERVGRTHPSFSASYSSSSPIMVRASNQRGRSFSPAWSNGRTKR